MKWKDVAPELKPCAHCKGKARHVFCTSGCVAGTYVQCEECGIRTASHWHLRGTGEYEPELKAAEDWNRRP